MNTRICSPNCHRKELKLIPSVAVWKGKLPYFPSRLRCPRGQGALRFEYVHHPFQTKKRGKKKVTGFYDEEQQGFFAFVSAAPPIDMVSPSPRFAGAGPPELSDFLLIIRYISERIV